MKKTSRKPVKLFGIACSERLPIPIKKIIIEKSLFFTDLSLNNKKDIKIKKKFVKIFNGSENKYKLVLSQ